MTKKRGTIVEGGRMYRRRTPAGPLLPAPATGTPDLWVCRRLVDFPPGTLPAVAVIAPCSRCGAAVAYNPDCTVVAPRVCMQCADIQPLPISSEATR